MTVATYRTMEAPSTTTVSNCLWGGNVCNPPPPLHNGAPQDNDDRWHQHGEGRQMTKLVAVADNEGQ